MRSTFAPDAFAALLAAVTAAVAPTAVHDTYEVVGQLEKEQVTLTQITHGAMTFRDLGAGRKEESFDIQGEIKVWSGSNNDVALTRTRAYQLLDLVEGALFDSTGRPTTLGLDLAGGWAEMTAQSLILAKNDADGGPIGIVSFTVTVHAEIERSA